MTKVETGGKRRGQVSIFSLEARIKRSLRDHLWRIGFTRNGDGELVPPQCTKEAIRQLHAAQRRAKLRENGAFIRAQWPKLKKYFADGQDVSPQDLTPELELIAGGTWQSDLFRLASLTWSVPVSQGYGRRLRFLVWDRHNDRLIGLIALGDPVFNLKVRDEWVGWTVEDRRERLVGALDAYVLGAIPPYNQLLGGKLLACLIRTQEVRAAFGAKYRQSTGIISKKKKSAELCIVTTSSALGRSSVYNRLALGGRQYFESLGFTAGWGHFHIPDSLFAQMRQYLAEADDEYAGNHQYGDGPNWRLRAIRKVLSRMNLNPDLMRHGITREVLACQLADNAAKALKDGNKATFRNLLSLEDVSELARERWIVPRAERMPGYRAWSRDGIRDLLRHRAMASGRQAANG